MNKQRCFVKIYLNYFVISKLLLKIIFFFLVIVSIFLQWSVTPFLRVSTTVQDLRVSSRLLSSLATTPTFDRRPTSPVDVLTIHFAITIYFILALM